MSALAADPAALESWTRDPPRSAALVYLLRFADPATGAEAFRTALAPVLAAARAEITWGADTTTFVIGAGVVPWHAAVAVRLPSRGAAITMLRTAAYREADARLADVVTDAHLLAGEPAAVPGVVLAMLRGVSRVGRLLGMPDREPAELGEIELGDDLHPTAETIAALSADPRETPVGMINFLAYAPRATYPPGHAGAGVSGRTAYLRYGRVAIRSVYLLGGRLVLQAKVCAVLRAGHDPNLAGPWDDVAVVQYPARRRFRTLMAMPGYPAATHHRVAGLARTRLIASDPWPGFVVP